MCRPRNASPFLGLYQVAFIHTLLILAYFDHSSSAVGNATFMIATWYYYNMAITYYKKGDYKEAIKRCDRAIELGGHIHQQFLDLLRPHR